MWFRGSGVVGWLIMAGVMALQGCSKNGNNVTDPASAPLPGHLMLVQASPDAPLLDLFIDSVRVQTDIAYSQSTGYVSVNAGVRTISLIATASRKTVFTALLPVHAGWNYTIMGTDSVSRCLPLLVVDDLTAPPAGKAKLRFSHLSPNAPAADVVIRGGATLFPGMNYKSTSDFVAVDTGSVVFNINAAGTANVMAADSGETLKPGKIYTLLLRGFAGAAGATALSAGVLELN